MKTGEVVLARRFATFALMATMTCQPALAADDISPIPVLPPGLTVAVRDTLDLGYAASGVAPGPVALNKLQLSATLRGERMGLPGWQIHTQIIRLDGRSLSKRLGDIQTADNIEAPHALRIFEAYLAKTVGSPKRQVALRVGMIDLNSQFDSIDAASIMINSSQGIGPDLSKSGRNGPSIFPFAGLGATASWSIQPKVGVHVGIFDGVAGSVVNPNAFFAARLRPSDGAFGIIQGDWLPSTDSRVQGGVWTYTAAQRGPLDIATRDRGAYISYEGPLGFIKKSRFWVRLGIANDRAQPVAGYIGAGFAKTSLLPGRADDRLGLSVSHAIIGTGSAAALGLHHAETSLELTYQTKLSSRFVIQPDIDYIHNPAGFAHAHDALSLLLRFAYAIAAPRRVQANDPGDPTIPPDVGPTLNDN